MARHKGERNRILGIQDRGGSGPSRYRVRYFLDGDPAAKSFATREEAEDFRREFLKEKAIDEAPTVGEVIQLWEQDRARVGKPLQRTQVRGVMQILARILDLKINRVTTAQVQAGYESEASRLAVISQHHELGNTRRFFDWAIKHQYIRRNPAEAIELIGVWEPSRPHIAKKADVRTFHEIVWKRTADGCRKSLGVLIGLYMGLRTQEILSLEKRHLDPDPESPSLWVPGTKTRKAVRRLALAPRLADLIAYLVASDQLDDRMVPYTDKTILAVVKEVGAQVGIENAHKLTIRSLRGLVSSVMETGRVAQQEIENFMGHESIRTTRSSYMTPSAPVERRQSELEDILSGATLATKRGQSWPGLKTDEVSPP